MNEIVDNYKFVVDKKTYCFWGIDLKQLNINFLNSLDPSYFKFVATTAMNQIDDSNKMHASILIRNNYFHSLETFFSLLCATIQAPHLTSAWIMKCSNIDLRNIVTKILKGTNELPNRLNQKLISFNSITSYLFSVVNFGTNEINVKVQENFTSLWQCFAKDFLDNKNIAEYNSIKHGFRLKKGGFGIAIGPEETPGIPCPREKMKSLGYNEFGSSYFEAKPIGVKIKKKRQKNYQLVRNSLNWSPDAEASKTLLVVTSLKNLISFLKMVMNIKSDIKFVKPEKDEMYLKPWSVSCSPHSFSTSDFIFDETVPNLSDEEILKEYKLDINKNDNI